MKSTFFSILSLVALVSAHGRLTNPSPRKLGATFKSVCGEQMFNQQSADPGGNIEGMAQVAGPNFDPSKCQLELCRGYQFADNTGNVQSFTPGQKIDITVSITAPHTGTANVSLVDTAKNTIIGSPLISFTNYASTKTGVAANNTAFSVTMPNSLPSQCGTAGNCVLQWFWFSDEAHQTYINCVDFTFASGSGSKSGSGSNSIPSPATSSSAVPTTLLTSTSPAATPTKTAVSSTPTPASAKPASPCRRRRALRNAARAQKAKDAAN